MKGLLLSVGVFVVYVILTALASHLARCERHSRLFVLSMVIAILAYGAAYLLLPANLAFLPPAWQSAHPSLDFAFGAGVLLLNIHNYGDWFYGFNGGFSTSLILLISVRRHRGATARELIGEYRDAMGRDKIHGWRLPRLVETGYLHLDQATGRYSLTEKGRRLAVVTRLLKRVLNLGRGG